MFRMKPCNGNDLMNVWAWWDIEIRTLDGDGENLVGVLMVGKHFVVKLKFGNFLILYLLFSWI